MNTFVTEAVQQHDIRAHSISLIGPLVSVAGLVWAILQPNRITLLHPRGQGFWWLAVEPPLYLVGAGIVFVLVVARPLLADLEGHRATTR
jgi:hypothetical protein